MNEDIVPGLLAAIEDDFKKSFQSDDTLKMLYAKVENGTATQADGEKFAHELGKLTAAVFHRNVRPEDLPNQRMYYNIANRIIPPTLRQNHGIVNEVMRQVIESQNREAGIGIRYQEPEFDKLGAMKLVWAATSDDYDKARGLVERGIDTHTRRVADDAVVRNAEFQSDAGFTVKVHRDTDGDCCNWCTDMAGTYDFEKAPGGVWGRHDNCGCTISYDSSVKRKNGSGGKRWTSETEYAMLKVGGEAESDRSPEKIEARKLISGVGEELTPLQREFAAVLTEQLADKRNAEILYKYATENAKALFPQFTPESMKVFLEKHGFSVMPLSRGALEGDLFEEGGGYKINYGGSGEFQYHPKRGSHHGDAYWKISCANKKTIRFSMTGEEVNKQR